MLSINIDLSQIQELMGLGNALQAASKEAAVDLAHMIHARAQELANERLHSTRAMFVKGLSVKEEEGVVCVVLDGHVRFIDDGFPAHSMLESLLASPKAKRAKDGSKYIIIPFSSSPGQGKTSTTPAQQDMMGVVKAAMKARGIAWSKTEVDSTGKAKIGKLHSFSVMDAPTKTAEGPGMGKGPIGSVKQGPTGIPFGQSINIYQNMGANGKVKRSVMTFRVASSKHAGQDRWNMPERAGVHIMDDAADWAVKTFQDEIAPNLLSKVLADLE